MLRHIETEAGCAVPSAAELLAACRLWDAWGMVAGLQAVGVPASSNQL